MPAQISANIGQMRYQDVGTGIIDILQKAQAREDQQLAHYQETLKDYAPIAEQKTTADVFGNVKAGLDTEFNQNLALMQAERDTKYKTGLETLNAQYKDAEANHIVKYDEDGKAIPFESSQAGLEHKKLKEAFESEFSLLDQQIAAAKATGYDPTKVQKRMQEQLLGQGVGLERALQLSTAAASPYQAVPMTDLEKSVLESKLSQSKDVTKAELDRLGKLSEGNLKITSLGKGVSVGSDGSISFTGAGGKVKTYSANELAEAEKDIMGKFDNLGWGIWKDNKEIVSDYLQPLYREFAGYMTPKDINDAIISFRDDGFIKDTLKPGTTPEKVREVLKNRLTQEAAASNKGYVTTGQAGISNEEYNTRKAKVIAEGDKRLANIQAQFGKTSNRTTALSRLQYTLANMSGVDAKVIDNVKPDTTQEQKIETKKQAKGLFADDNSPLGKAMKSSNKGELSSYVKEHPSEFKVWFEKLSDNQKKNVTKVLANSTTTKDTKTITKVLETPKTNEPTSIVREKPKVESDFKSNYKQNKAYGSSGNTVRKFFSDINQKLDEFKKSVNSKVSVADTTSARRTVKNNKKTIIETLSSFKEPTVKKRPGSSVRTYSGPTLIETLRKKGLTTEEIKAIPSSIAIPYKFRKQVEKALTK